MVRIVTDLLFLGSEQIKDDAIEIISYFLFIVQLISKSCVWLFLRHSLLQINIQYIHW